MITTFTAPKTCAGAVAVIEVLLPTLTLVAAVPPSVTLAPLRKPVPVIVMDVPPDVVPELGDIAVTVGAAFGEPPWTRNATICMTQSAEPLLAVAL
jgi:hypothetical protein